MTSQNPGRFWRAGDADPAALDGERVAVLGYGNLGRAMALNLGDVATRARGASIDRVIVGNIDD
ncbi:MAG: hypothetical protein EHM56_04575, partial [Chloroflexi bacterium]